MATSDDSLLALSIPATTSYVRSAPSDGHDEKLTGAWSVVDEQWPSHSLVMHERGRWSSMWLMWTTSWAFGGWYVNFEDPWRRTPLGYDTRDLALDLIVTTEYETICKDRDEFDFLVENGAIDESARVSVLEEQQRVVADVGDRRGPFSPSHQSWRPTTSDPPVLPSNWAAVKGASER